MLTLAIETSTRTGSVALFQEAGLSRERVLANPGRRHAQTLITEIDSLLGEHSLSLNACGLIAVSIGPGSFTGLRVGVVCAKTLAYAIRCPLVAVDTFEAIAVNSPDDVNNLFVVGDAQRGGLFVGQYLRDSDSTWAREGDIVIADAEEWTMARSSTDIVCGWGVERAHPELANRCRVLDRDAWNPIASKVALIGRRMADQNQYADCMTLEPFYLRLSAAEERLPGKRN